MPVESAPAARVLRLRDVKATPVRVPRLRGAKATRAYKDAIAVRVPRLRGVDPTHAHDAFMREAVQLSLRMMRRGAGGPFGAVVVRKGVIIGRGWNRVTVAKDPTAHAEVVAIRRACRELRTFHLADSVLYTSCEPCPMCLSAIYWARIPTVFYANTRADAARIGFNDDLIYREVALPIRRRKLAMRQLLHEEALAVFAEWAGKADKVMY